MSLLKLILKSTWHYRRLNLTIALGIALSTAILVGALIIGDSVKFSLQQITIQRLGNTSQVITAGERLFHQQLAKQITGNSKSKASPLLRANGFAVIEGGELRINQLAVWGIDSTFSYFAIEPTTFNLKDNEVAINENLAEIAGLKMGDEFLLRVNKLNTFPANTPFVAEKEATLSFRVTVTQILKPSQLGNFSLQNIQSAPRNVFVNLSWLNKQMGLTNKANVLLLSEGISKEEISNNLQKSWTTDDINLQVRENENLNYTEVISDRVFIEPMVEQFFNAQLPDSRTVFSYFINDFSFNGKQTPYSFVSTDESLSGEQISVSQWLAEDLNLKVKDTVRLSYFEIGPLRRLIQKDTIFIVERIYNQEGKFADQNLMPVIPGLSDAGNCRDWKTGVPVDLKKIRTKDEAYWNALKGTPKAFISLKTAQKLWANRFGQSTAIRVDGLKKAELEKIMLSSLQPSQMGYDLKDVKAEGLAAASNGTDFGQLFIGLSFFVLFAAMLLVILLFQLYLGFRKAEIGNLSAMGFSIKTIRNLFLAESSIIILAGILLGMPFAILYNQLILKAINTIWVDIVRTSIVNIYIRPVSLAGGSLMVALLSVIVIYFILKRFLKQQVIDIQRKSSSQKAKNGRLSLWIGLSFIILSLSLLLIKGISNGETDPELFFISGFGMLPGMILLFNYLLHKLSTYETASEFSYRSLLLKRVAGERKRTVMIVSFLSVGIFMVVSTGLNRKDLSAHAELPSSGTGGYDYFVETTMPVLFDVNTPKGKETLDLPSETQVVQFQVQQGDDASCLNLNRVARPRIIACNPMQLNERSAFTFVAKTEDLDTQNQWLSLNKTLADSVIPAIADQTVIQWSLGKKIGDTLIYKDETGKALKLKLIGGLANSVFQGNVIISENHFAKAFPSVSGSAVFLIDAPDSTLNTESIQNGWRNYGPQISSTTDRLLAFYQIENTYLNIFLMLGALGLLIGTIGLGILIFRITFEHIPEYALMRSVGFQKSGIYSLLLKEKLILMVVSVLIGIIPAILSGLPSLMSSLYAKLWIWLPIIALLVIISGILWTIMAVRLALKQDLIQALRND
jgi:ABC-type antimicrobial peptide transport system permease subunit